MRKVPEGWEERRLEDLVEILDGQRVPVNARDRELRVGSVPYYGATGQVGWIDRPIFNEELLLLGEDGVSFLDQRKSKAYLISGPSWVNNHAHVLRAREGATSNRYLLHYLNWFDFHGYVTGTTRLKLTQGAMRPLPVCLPGLGKQRDIVEVIEEQFSRLDAGVGSLQRAKRNLTRLQTAVLETAVDRNWPLQPLKTLVSDLKYGTSVKCSYEGLGVPVLRIPNVRKGRVDMDDLKRAIPKDLDLSAETVVTGDLLFIRTNGSRELIGTVAAVDGAASGLAFASYLIRARPLPHVVPKYLQLALSSPHAREEIMNGATTSAGQYNVNARTLGGVHVPVGPVDEQERVVTEVERQFSIIDAMATIINAGLTRAGSLRQSILSQAFAGKLTGVA